MFNLIVSGGLENERRGSISAGRVFEYTNNELVAHFKPDGRLAVAKLTALPTLFMTEGTGDENANIGWLSAIELRGGEYQLQYTYDSTIPCLTNGDIYTIASELQLDEWEFTRNHWAIKDIDLFQVLYRKLMGARPLPSVFQLSRRPVKSKLITLMMPFSAEFREVYETVKAALEGAGYECKCADDFWFHSHIMQDIVELICTSQVVICDLSGKNPNVFYEAGIAHTLGKEVILITQHMGDVPFDLRALRCIHYLRNQEGCAKLAADILARVKTVA